MRDKKYKMALISKYRKLSRSPMDDQRKTVGINEMAIIAALKTRSSRPLSLAIFISKNVARVENVTARNLPAIRSENPQ